jgi:hypothetical protein
MKKAKRQSKSKTAVKAGTWEMTDRIDIEGAAGS